MYCSARATTFGNNHYQGDLNSYAYTEDIGNLPQANRAIPSGAQTLFELVPPNQCSCRRPLHLSSGRSWQQSLRQNIDLDPTWWWLQLADNCD